MKKANLWQSVSAGGLAMVLSAATGCQTNVVGMTLPSGHYLQHPPQYFAPSPAFPLQRELAGMEAQAAAQAGVAGAAAGVAPVPPPAPVTPGPAPAEAVPAPARQPAPAPPPPPQ